MPCLKRVLAIIFWGISGVCVTAEAQSPESPFVAGFERFGRHDEITSRAAGRLLARELSCTACHPAKNPLLKPKRGPSLGGAGNRLQADWIKAFLAAPEKQKPGATMPNLFAGWPAGEKKRAIEALSAFLTSRQKAFPVLKASGHVPVPFEFWNKGNPARGKQLFHQIGCVACHEPDSTYDTVETKPSPVDQLLEQLTTEELESMGLAGKARRIPSVPHGDLAAKYSPQSLTFFLLDPEKNRPSGRMPNLGLQPVEAADIAAYLLRDQKSDFAISRDQPANSLIEKGRELFVKLRCSNCHNLPGIQEKLSAKQWDELNPSDAESCLNPPARGRPNYQLDNPQAEALSMVFNQEKNDRDPSAQDRLQARLLSRNCYACHEREKRGGVGRYRKAYFETVGHVDLGDEGRLPPPLTGVGSKLTRSALRKVIKGAGDVRPHLRARMPNYANDLASSLTEMFAETDSAGRNIPSEKQVFGDLKSLAEAGRKLMDQGCVQCHPFGGEALPGVVGVDLAGITQRVRPDWFDRFLTNPASLKPRTRMPTFFPKGESQNAKVLDGDAARQRAAMWAYLKELDKQKLPQKIEQARSQNYVLKPKDRPLVLRTFMKEAGTHAIAVGFPESVHFTFDAEICRLAVAWRGRFLDAEGTWFSRFTPPAKPLGDDLIELPPGLPFASLKNSQASWPKPDPVKPAYEFRGYRLDSSGVPTFLYRYEGFQIEDRIKPAGKQQLIRRLTIIDRKPKERKPAERKPANDGPVLWFRPLAGKSIKFNGSSGGSNKDGLTVKIPKELGGLGENRQTEAGAEWIIPLPEKTKQTIEVQYQW